MEKIISTATNNGGTYDTRSAYTLVTLRTLYFSLAARTYFAAIGPITVRLCSDTVKHELHSTPVDVQFPKSLEY